MDAASQFGDLVRGVRHSGGFEILGQLLGAARSMVFGWSIQKTDVVHDNRRQHNTHVSALCFAYDNRVQGVAVDVFPVMSGQLRLGVKSLLRVRGHRSKPFVFGEVTLQLRLQVPCGRRLSQIRSDLDTSVVIGMKLRHHSPATYPELTTAAGESCPAATSR